MASEVDNKTRGVSLQRYLGIDEKVNNIDFVL